MSIIPGPTSSGGQALTVANGGTIATGAERTLQLVFRDSNSHSYSFDFDFIQGQVDGPILGIDFIRQFKMSVDPLAACVRRSDGTVFPGSLSTSLSNVVLSAIPSDIQHLVEVFSRSLHHQQADAATGNRCGAHSSHRRPSSNVQVLPARFR